MAGRLCGFFRESIEFGTGETIHRRAGGASSKNQFSRRVARVIEEARNRMGRKICLGLNGERCGRNPVGVVLILECSPKVGAGAPTLGWRTQSLWDCLSHLKL